MSIPMFHSSLSPEEISENFKDVDFFSGIMDGLEEALAYEKGDAAGIKIIDETDPEKTVIAAAKSDSTTSLINEVNTILDELRADGTLTELSNKYFGYDATKLPE